MRHIISKFLLLSPENVSIEVYVALAGIYLLLWGITILSVISKKSSIMSRMAWFLLITFLPVVGIAVYSVSCLVNQDYQFLKQFGFGESKATSTFARSNSPLNKTSSQPSI